MVGKSRKKIKLTNQVFNTEHSEIFKKKKKKIQTSFDIIPNAMRSEPSGSKVTFLFL